MKPNTVGDSAEPNWAPPINKSNESNLSFILAKDKSMALVGSVITSDMEENHIYGGSPAKDLTNKIKLCL